MLKARVLARRFMLCSPRRSVKERQEDPADPKDILRHSTRPKAPWYLELSSF